MSAEILGRIRKIKPEEEIEEIINKLKPETPLSELALFCEDAVELDQAAKAHIKRNSKN